MEHERLRAALNCLVEESQIGGELHVQQQLLHQRANLPGDPSESVSDIGGFFKGARAWPTTQHSIELPSSPDERSSGPALKQPHYASLV